MKRFLGGKLFMSVLIVCAAGSIILIILAWQRPIRYRMAPAGTAATGLLPGHPPVDGSASVTGKDKAKEEEFHSLDKLLKDNSDHTPILFRLAELSREMGNQSKAISYLGDILKKEPDNSDAHLELGRR